MASESEGGGAVEAPDRRRTAAPEGARTGAERHGPGEKAADRAREAKAAVEEKAAQARREIESRAEEVKEEAKDRARQVRDETERRADRWTEDLGHRAETLARALSAAADSLRHEGERSMADVAGSAAEQVERMSGYLEEEDPSAMLHDFEDLGRRNPGAFLGSAFSAGLLAGRFLRASRPDGGNGHAAPAPEADPVTDGRTAATKDADDDLDGRIETGTVRTPDVAGARAGSGTPQRGSSTGSPSGTSRGSSAAADAGSGGEGGVA